LIEELELEYQRNPDSIEANCAIAEYYISHDAAERAEPYLIKALELDEEVPSIHNRLGMVNTWTKLFSSFSR
jgi:Tfp pilus assembly protein PilF